MHVNATHLVKLQEFQLAYKALNTREFSDIFNYICILI